LKDEADIVLTEKYRNELDELFYPVSHENLTGLKKHLEDLGVRAAKGGYSLLDEMLKLPSFPQITAYYEDIIGRLPLTEDQLKDFSLKMLYLRCILETKGLSVIHDVAIREVGRTLAAFIRTGGHQQITEILAAPVTALRNIFASHPDTTLHSIHSAGSEIYNSGESVAVEWFGHEIVSFGFQYPKVKGMTDEWQLISNKSHLRNIRVWLDLIEMNPKWSKSLISALMINLSLAGVNIVDTDLFQKDITKLLDSDVKPVYHFVKQLVLCAINNRHKSF
jgi:pyruvate,orthophosphate dikinase